MSHQRIINLLLTIPFLILQIFFTSCTELHSDLENDIEPYQASGSITFHYNIKEEYQSLYRYRVFVELFSHYTIKDVEEGYTTTSSSSTLYYSRDLLITEASGSFIIDGLPKGNYLMNLSWTVREKDQPAPKAYFTEEEVEISIDSESISYWIESEPSHVND
ncbi:hypothetical protein [Flammeovirga aprica]|uniref:Uncharacterized protein n=1 Tax=Flammeovirga aprica JL-4 TaxID=694437 RepID=A0A7X9RXF4_9BACT|nr:hypothetical protein [Flammeovirga aprica]NME70563.1 hypothetical protein [Flammeovirga aprica JL-4]